MHKKISDPIRLRVIDNRDISRYKALIFSCQLLLLDIGFMGFDTVLMSEGLEDMLCGTKRLSGHLSDLSSIMAKRSFELEGINE